MSIRELEVDNMVRSRLLLRPRGNVWPVSPGWMEVTVSADPDSKAKHTHMVCILVVLFFKNVYAEF